jgi:hypothetical protein
MLWRSISLGQGERGRFGTSSPEGGRQLTLKLGLELPIQFTFSLRHEAENLGV